MAHSSTAHESVCWGALAQVWALHSMSIGTPLIWGTFLAFVFVA
jgi:hypothetical protein